MTTYIDRTSLGQKFHSVLTQGDWEGMRALLAPTVSWVLPGDNAISGPADGRDAVVERVRLIAGYGVKFTLKHILLSRDNMAFAYHNTAERDGVRLDEQLATVCQLGEDGLITMIETYLSDVDGMNAFFKKI